MHLDEKHMKKSLSKNTISPRSKNYLNIYTKSSGKLTQASSGEKKPEITPVKLTDINSEDDDSCDNLEVPTGKFN
jgi:hypothetical protein